MPTNQDLRNLAHTAFQAGDYQAARELFEQVVAQEPADAVAHCNLGGVHYRLGQFAEAAACYRRALQLQPNFAEAYNNLGLAANSQGRFAEAITCYQQALRLKPDYVEAYVNLGLAHKAQNDLPEAAAAYRQALGLNPHHAEAHYNLGNTLRSQGLLDEALASYEEALRCRPNYYDAYLNKGNILKDQGRLDDALASYRTAQQLEPDKPTAASNVLYTMLFHPRFEAHAQLEEHRRWERQYAQHLAVAHTFANDPSPKRRLRIGYVSPDFSEHVIGRNVWPLVRRHDRQSFEIYLYDNAPKGDALALKFRQAAERWCPIVDWDDERVAEQIRRDQIDILVDLTLHMAGNRLLVFARKPVPVQVTFAGYPGTTGLGTIDYRLTDPYLDPPGQEDDCYVERSTRLPHSFWCYDAESEEPPVSPLPALKWGFVTFGCLNNFCKINGDALRLWAQVLTAVPGSRLLLLASPGRQRQRVVATFTEMGIAAGRIEFCAPRAHRDYLTLFQQIDIGLDSLPYNGHSTSLDSYWMGVPVITLVGKTVVGRAGLSQLTNLGLAELAVRTPGQFVERAAELAGDLAKLESLRLTMRERMRNSPLTDAEGFARGIEAAYRDMWRAWCAGSSFSVRVAPCER
jgi:protein O-GlcNAc transferase